ncbi:MAG: hypothetical protein JW908_14825 [Anaerolineales bacterium]|nr:hypothetical protein [Anaerolineales bacterium]
MVTYRRVSFFGEIVDGIMQLNPMGDIVHDVWYALPERFTNGTIDEMVTMPYHFQGIIFLDDSIIQPKQEISQAIKSDQQNESAEEYRIRRRKMTIPKLVEYFQMNSTRRLKKNLATQQFANCHYEGAHSLRSV